MSGGGEGGVAAGTTARPCVELHGIAVRYGQHRALDNVSLAFRGGEVLALIGPNGSGKSTLLRAIAGLQRHDGRVALHGLAREAIGFLPQDSGSRAALTVLETVLLGRRRALGLRVPAAEVARVGRVLGQLDLERLAGRMLGELSGGQRQLVFLAQVLVAEPAVLLLDEPTSALDLRHQMELLALVRRLARETGLAAVIAIHDLNAAARFADRIAVLSQGRLVATGAAAEVLTASMLAEVYGVEARIHRDAEGLPHVVPMAALPRGAATAG